MNRQKALLIAIVLALIVSILWYFYRDTRRHILIDHGNVVIQAVEDYRRKNGELPLSLQVIGFKEDPLYYRVWDSTNFVVSFGESFDPTAQYRSWEKRWIPIGVDR